MKKTKSKKKLTQEEAAYLTNCKIEKPAKRKVLKIKLNSPMHRRAGSKTKKHQTSRDRLSPLSPKDVLDNDSL
jgi:hypothetical protein